METEQICAELERVRHDYPQLLETATVAELGQPTLGTKWTNEQPPFHILFGYLLVRNLRFVVGGFSRLPDGASRRFAVFLNAGTGPFHGVHYVGSLFGARILGYPRMVRLTERILDGLARSLRAQPKRTLNRGMHSRSDEALLHGLPDLAGVLRLPPKHDDHHRQQLTIAGVRG